MANETWLWLKEMVKITKELATNYIIWGHCGYRPKSQNPRLNTG